MKQAQTTGTAEETKAVAQAPVVEFEDGAEDDFLFAEDAEGNRVDENQLTAKATTPTIVKFEVYGVTHKAQIIFGNVSYATRRAPTEISNRMSAEAGINDASDDLLGAVELDKRIQGSRDYQGARAAIALEAVTRKADGSLNITVPALRNINHAQLTALLTAPKPEQEMDAHFARNFVRAVIGEVGNFFS
jgi:hypothetical protein